MEDNLIFKLNGKPSILRYLFNCQAQPKPQLNYTGLSQLYFCYIRVPGIVLKQLEISKTYFLTFVNLLQESSKQISEDFIKFKGRWKTTSVFQASGRRPQFLIQMEDKINLFGNWSQSHFFKHMEDDNNFETSLQTTLFFSKLSIK